MFLLPSPSSSSLIVACFLALAFLRAALFLGVFVFLARALLYFLARIGNAISPSSLLLLRASVVGIAMVIALF
jgi:hypothetical protein